ncbi:MAG TPA: amino acid adenylation domain-containing protein [Pyrinomonadaceae bacterium]|nr:amino acid adenylation domain-containing protein [Pyrinomonadaceae bacterium]
MSLSKDKRALLELLVRGDGNGNPLTSNAVNQDARVKPTSNAQRRLWFLDQINHDQTAYTLHSVQRLNWAIDPSLMQRTIHEIAKRHEILRTTFVVEKSEPVQRIAATAAGEISTENLREVPADKRRAEVMRRMSLVVARRFNLEEGPLWRTILYQLDEREWVFLLAVHHIVFDGPSFNIFFSELEKIYGALDSGRAISLPAQEVQYGDFAQSQHEGLTSDRIAAEVGFWRTELADLPMLDLPLDRRRSVVQAVRGGLRRFHVSEEVSGELLRLASAHSVTFFTVLLAALGAALARVCGQYDFAVGLPVTGRDSVALGQAIGFFVDTVVVRFRLQDNPMMKEVIERTRDAVKRSLAHRALPFEMMVEHLRPVRGLGINPFFQVGFQLMQNSGGSGGPDAFEVPRSGAMFDLGFDLWKDKQRLEGRLEFNSDLFNTGTVDLIVSLFKQTLKEMNEPDRRLHDLEFTGEAEFGDRAIIEGERQELDQTLMEVLSATAAEHSDAVALEGPGQRFTYQELYERVARVSTALTRVGVKQGTFVALALPRSVDLVIFELATLYAGAAFILIDPNWPTVRRQSVMQDARPVLMIDVEAASGLMRDDFEKSSPQIVGHQDAAYVIFTSGSSGVPKGVVIERAGLLNVAVVQRQVFRLGPGRRVVQLAQPSFDASIFELTLALAAGATLVVPPPDLLVGDELAAFLEAQKVDTIVLPPTLLASMQPSEDSTLQLILVAGESCSLDLARKWIPGREFWNLYGPTEGTIWATLGQGESGSRVPIGRPIPNVSTMVLNASLHPVPVGVPGELCLAGVGLARGYLNSPELTATKFVNDPLLPSRRIYRTGDLVRQLPCGDLVFLGRTDRQAKIHGFRIEPEEVETALRKHSEVADAVVTTHANNGSEPVLVAYLQSRSQKNGLEQECRQLLRDTLPSYMIPNYFVFLDEFPRTASGKIDHSALPPPHLEASRDTYVEPSTDTERCVAELMANATRLGRVGAEDDFFQIGGHSLAAAELVRNARAIFKVNLAIGDVFVHPTVSALAARISQLKQLSVPEDEFDLPLVRLPRQSRSKAKLTKSMEV